MKIPTTIALLAALALTACGRNDAPSRADFETGLRSYLANGHGQLCLAMYDWPMDLTEAEAGAGSRRALQLPVFEKLGLAGSTIVQVPRSATNPDGAIKRYTLTDEGRRYYKPHPHTGRDGSAHPDDLCVADITLDKVEGWEIDPKGGQPLATVRYSYHIAPAPWMKDADAIRVLPMVDRIIQGADGRLQLHQGFMRGPQGWSPVAGPV